MSAHDQDSAELRDEFLEEQRAAALEACERISRALGIPADEAVEVVRSKASTR